MGKKKSRKRLIGGGISLAMGVIILAWAFGVFAMIPTGMSALSTTGQVAGISMTSSIRNYPLLSEVAPRGTYEWEVGVTNTGTLGWTDAWFCVRTLKTTSTPILISHPSYAGNPMYVGQCAEGTDTLACRENIESSSPIGWDMRYLSSITGGNWWDIYDANMGDQVFCPSMGALSSGQSITWRLRMTVPEGVTEGSFPVIATSGANIANYGYIIASKLDMLTIGTVEGTMVFVGIGTVFSVLGAILLAFSRKPV